MTTDIRNRVKLIYLDERLILGIFNKFRRGFFGSGDHVALPVIADLPSDMEFVSCWHDPQRCAFGFLVEHVSFEEVQPNHVPPTITNPFMGSMVRTFVDIP